MELIRTTLIQELRKAREMLLNIHFIDNRITVFALDKDDQTGKFTKRPVKRPPKTKPSVTPYDQVVQWLDKWDPTFKRYRSFRIGTVYLRDTIFNRLDGYENESDPEVFNVLRPVFVECIDSALSVLDQGYEIRPLIEDYTKRVKDTKLAELLKEFNAAKDRSPNLAAIGFRTILGLIIREKAKRVNPTSNTATRTDIDPTKMIASARTDNILSQDEQRLVNSFVSTHKDIFDFVTHRPNVLIDKSEVDTMVDLLNKLLPAIIN